MDLDEFSFYDVYRIILKFALLLWYMPASGFKLIAEFGPSEWADIEHITSDFCPALMLNIQIIMDQSEFSINLNS